MREMSGQERLRFLSEGTRTAKLATVRADGSPDALPWSTRIGARYMGADQAEAFGRRNAVPGELLVRLRPTRVVARAGIAD